MNYFMYLGIDIGGTWIKGAMAGDQFLQAIQLSDMKYLHVNKVNSPLHTKAKLSEFVKAMNKLIASLQVKYEEINGIGISTAGIVNYHGTKILRTAPHLNILKCESWTRGLEKKFQCKVSLINDADATTIGLAETGVLTGNKTVGILAVGTGLGFSVWRNGRRWRPGRSLPLLGSIKIPDGNFDTMVSAAGLASIDENNNLINVLTNLSYQKERESYIQNLVKVINSAAILYNLNNVFICGGLADAAIACDYPLEKNLNDSLQETPVELEKSVKVVVSNEGNRLQLIGALALAKGESIAIKDKIDFRYNTVETEIPYRKDIQLQNMRSTAIIKIMWQAEQEAGETLKSSLPFISNIAGKSVDRIRAGGRMIYVGAGTSGRIAAMDAIEIPCTYGFPEDRMLALIAGGISDEAMSIESDFEEDASAVPEMLLLNIQSKDVVIGISSSGAAYYVQSALAFAKGRKALSVLIQTKLPDKKLPFCDYVIPLNSGNEVVAGSTRMKAGTATKKVLNFLSSTIMIKIGKVSGPYMVNVACINNKLVKRAQSILKILYGINEKDALKMLKKAEMDLRLVLKNIQTNKMEQS